MDKQRPKKQLRTAVRVYNRLKQEHGFTRAATTVVGMFEAKPKLGVSAYQVYFRSS